MTSSYAKILKHGQMSMFCNLFLGHLSTTCSSVAFRITWCSSSSCVVNNFFKHLLLSNRWQFGPNLAGIFLRRYRLKKCSQNLIPSKTLVAMVTEMEFLKQFFKNLLWNLWSDCEIVLQECSLGDPFQKTCAKFWSVNKHRSCERGLFALYGYKEILEKSFSCKPLVRF